MISVYTVLTRGTCVASKHEKLFRLIIIREEQIETMQAILCLSDWGENFLRDNQVLALASENGYVHIFLVKA